MSGGEHGDHEATPAPGDTVLAVDPAGRFVAPVRACGVERWAVKTTADPAATLIDEAGAKATTVADLNALPAPRRLPPTRIVPAETQIWVVEAMVTRAKIEADGDVHLVLVDGARQMIAELPSPTCLSPTNRFFAQMQLVRDTFTRAFAANTADFIPIKRRARLSGVAFFDTPHGQTGVALNAVELHPVLHLEWLPG